MSLSLVSNIGPNIQCEPVTSSNENPASSHGIELIINLLNLKLIIVVFAVENKN